MFSDSATHTNVMDNYTVTGHVVGMLDRDQRTAKLRCDSYRQSAMFFEFHSHYYYVHPRETIIPHEKTSRRHSLKRKTSHSTRSRKNSYLWNTLRRLKQALIAGIYLLSLVSVPCSLSAPTRLSHMAARNESGKWVDPCNFKGADTGAEYDSIPMKEDDSELLLRIVTQASIAFNQADQFKEDFAQKVFNSNFKQVHEDWKGTDFEWLPQRQHLHKSLNESVPEQHLETVSMDDALLNTYHYLQMVAVGLEQVVWDQEDDDGPLLRNFNQSEHNLRSVLCEMQTAIYERGIHQRMMEDVKRDIMPEYVRDASNRTTRNLRDWIIYREYMNALEYVIQVFTYLKDKL